MNWIDNADSYICPACGEEVSNPANLNFTCPKCGFVAEKDKPVVSKVMSEQRLIDATSLKILFEHEYRHNKQFKQSSAYKAWQGAIQLLYDQPIIDPETLPIVRELREQLERVTAERDSYKIFFEDITKCGDCNDCRKSATCEFVPKVGQTTRYNCPLWTGR